MWEQEWKSVTNLFIHKTEFTLTQKVQNCDSIIFPWNLLEPKACERYTALHEIFLFTYVPPFIDTCDKEWELPTKNLTIKMALINPNI